LVIFQFAHSEILAQYIKNSGELWVKGNVKRLTEKQYTAKLEMDEVELGELTDKTMYQFYEDGKVKSISYSGSYDNGDFRYNYTKDGRLVSRSKKTDYDTTLDTIQYSPENRVTKISRKIKRREGSIEDGFVYNYTYNANGDITQIVESNDANEYSTHPCFHCKELYTPHIESFTRFLSNSNELNDKIWSQSYNRVTAEYQYDQKGNWIKCTYFYIDNNKVKTPSVVLTREIVYFNE
jgi:hypothetical protein